MKRFILLGLLGGLLATNTGCGLLQAVFCCHPCGPLRRLRGRLWRRLLRRGLRAEVRADGSLGLSASLCPRLCRLRHRAAAAGAVRLAVEAAVEVAARATIPAPTRAATAAAAGLASWTAQLRLRLADARLRVGLDLVWRKLRRKVLGRLLQRPARLLGPVRLPRQLYGRPMPQLRRRI